MRKKPKRIVFREMPRYQQPPEMMNSYLAEREIPMKQRLRTNVQEPSSLEKFQFDFMKSSRKMDRSRLETLYDRRAKTLENQILHQNTKNLSKGVIEVKKEIKQLKNIYKDNQKEDEKKKLLSISTAIQELIREGRRPANQSPMYYPMPIYVPPQPQYPMPTRQSRYEDTFYKPKKSNNKIERKNRAQKNLKKWRKVGNAIMFIFYLRKFNNKAQQVRKKAFQQFFENDLKQKLSVVKKILIKGVRQIMNILLIKRDVDFEIEDDEKESIIRVKIESTRKMINILLHGIEKQINNNSNKVLLIEPIYFLCRHGNYSSSEALLNVEEMDMSCMSKEFNYVSAEKNLQKAAIINTVFIKLLLFNILQSNQVIQALKISSDETKRNLYLLSSILYELIMDVQDQYMLKVPKSYQIGNYKALDDDLKYLEPIVLAGKKYTSGQLISGFMKEELVNSKYRTSKWRDEKKKIKHLVEIIHKQLVKYHRNYVERIIQIM